MLRLYLLILFAILSFTFATYGQSCPEAIYTINFVQKEPVKYELFSVVPKGKNYRSEEFQKWLFSELFKNEIMELDSFYLRNKIKNKNAEKFLKNYNAENFEPIRGIQPDQSKIEGKVENGSIKFQTYETNFQLALLRISSEEYGKFYLLGRFLGGCYRTDLIDLKKHKITRSE